MAERTEEEVVTGLLRISIGGVVKMMPTLKAKWIDTWGELVAASAEGAPKPLGEWTMQDVARLSGQTVRRVIDLIVAYDREGALGGREWLEEHADPQELHAALVQMMGNAYPLADDPAGLTSLVIISGVVGSGQPSSTNGASGTGTGTRKRSARASTRSS